MARMGATVVRALDLGDRALLGVATRETLFFKRLGVETGVATPSAATALGVGSFPEGV
jgi:hypothetical protein|tara:strand:- start:117 stop:290 length:174 start_codon:yes stop_codon:yes gene_type:complete